MVLIRNVANVGRKKGKSRMYGSTVVGYGRMAHGRGILARRGNGYEAAKAGFSGNCRRRGFCWHFSVVAFTFRTSTHQTRSQTQVGLS